MAGRSLTVLRGSVAAFCSICLFIVQFQKVSIPTPRKANGNSKEEGLLKAQFFKGKYDAKLQFLEGGGGFKFKNLSRVVWVFPGTTHLQYPQLE